MKMIYSVIAAVALMFVPAAALAQAAAGGVGVGVTGGTYSAQAQSGGAVGNLIVGGQVGTFSQSAGTHSYASAGMAIGAVADTTLHVEFDGINNGAIGVTRSSSATIQGFGTAGSVTTISYEGDGAQAGIGAHFAASDGSASSNGAFLGVGIVGAFANSP
jgi:hypothetical protein